jgi:hypothetical protein
MKTGNPDFTRVLFYAARQAGKTVLTSIIEVLAVLHFSRDICHLAATLGQSQVNCRYIQKYGKLKYIRDFISGISERKIEFTRCVDDMGEVISYVQYKELPQAERGKYQEQTNFIMVIVANLAGTNAVHSQILAIDECELTPPAPIQESTMIPTDCRDGKPPITLLTSSWKFSFGMVSDELANAKERGTQVRHWNIVDVTHACPPSRHLPDEPRHGQELPQVHPRRIGR